MSVVKSRRSKARQFDAFHTIRNMTVLYNELYRQEEAI